MIYKYKVKRIDDYNIKELEDVYKKIQYDKKQRIDNYRLEEDIKRSLVGEKIIIDLLKESGFDYYELDFYTNKNGKTYINNRNDLFFNQSHSGKYVAGVISNKEIGIDIEEIKEVNINSIKKFASINELGYITSSNNDINKRYFEIFCLKEAYVKANGKCLKNINEVSFNIVNNTITCSDSNVVCFLKKDKNYILAIVLITEG